MNRWHNIISVYYDKFTRVGHQTRCSGVLQNAAGSTAVRQTPKHKDITQLKVQLHPVNKYRYYLHPKKMLVLLKSVS